MRIFEFLNKKQDSKDMIRKNESEKAIEKHCLEMTLGKKNDDEFKTLVLDNEESARIVYDNLLYRINPHISYGRILSVLNEAGRGKDLAEAEVKRLAYSFEFLNEKEPNQKELVKWLSGESDTMPIPMPKNKYIMFYNNRTNRELCFMSKVCTYPERLAIYGMMMGYVDIVRGPVKSMLEYISIEYVQDYLNRIENNYPVPKEDIMQMYTMILVAPHKMKKEIELYTPLIVDWLNNDNEQYWNAIAKLSDNYQKKIENYLLQHEIIHNPIK